MKKIAIEEKQSIVKSEMLNKNGKFSFNKKGLKVRLLRSLPLYAMLALPLIWYVVFCYLPMGGLVIAFQDYNPYIGFSSPWLTDLYGNTNIFGHFKEFLSDSYFWQVFGNTLRLGFFNTLICFPAPIILALMFNEMRTGKYKKITQSVSYLPYFVSTVAIINILVVMLSYSDGVLNNLRVSLGLDRVNYIAEPSAFVPIYIIENLWRCVGWGTIIYIASMANVNPELYEAADMDGAGRFRKIWYITLPAILPTIMIQLILAMPGILSVDFEAVLLLQRDQNLSVSDTIATYVYRRGLGSASGSARYDYGTAIGLFNSVINLVIVLITNWISKKTSDIGII